MPSRIWTLSISLSLFMLGVADSEETPNMAEEFADFSLPGFNVKGLQFVQLTGGCSPRSGPQHTPADRNHHLLLKDGGAPFNIRTLDVALCARDEQIGDSATEKLFYDYESLKTLSLEDCSLGNSFPGGERQFGRSGRPVQSAPASAYDEWPAFPALQEKSSKETIGASDDRLWGTSPKMMQAALQNVMDRLQVGRQEGIHPTFRPCGLSLDGPEQSEFTLPDGGEPPVGRPTANDSAQPAPETPQAEDAAPQGKHGEAPLYLHCFRHTPTLFDAKNPDAARRIAGEDLLFTVLVHPPEEIDIHTSDVSVSGRIDLRDQHFFVDLRMHPQEGSVTGIVLLDHAMPIWFSMPGLIRASCGMILSHSKSPPAIIPEPYPLFSQPAESRG